MSSQPKWIGPRLAHWWLVAPAVLLTVLMLAIPLAMMFSHSAYEFDPFKGSLPNFTLEHYQKLFSDWFVAQVLWRTIWISLATAVACLVVGYPVAYYFVFHAQRSRALIILGLVSPLFVSALVRNYGWLVVFGRGGPAERLLQWSGVIEGRLRFLQSEAAVILGLTHLFLAFMVLSIVTALRNIDPAVLRAAAIGGAGPVRTFLFVTLPLSVPGVMSGAIIVFSLSAGAFITPALMGGLKIRVMSLSIWEQVSVIHNYAFGSVLSIALLVVVVGVVLAGGRLARTRWAS
jgi:putative spermidine/putrescine transport system permease protein